MMYHMTKKNIDQHLDVLDLDLIVVVHHGVHIKKNLFFLMKDTHIIGFYLSNKKKFYLTGKYHLLHVQDFGHLWEAIR